MAVYVSSILIMFRCFYRASEFSEGIDGYPFRTEWLFWVFESLPMIGAISIFCIYHPSRFMAQEGVVAPKAPQSHSLTIPPVKEANQG
ncbi:hypothetical protein TOPH_07219 [Tolypocladium ophioglossoides CBS 100239]|uniref:Uncharacterized protein n=1 Tax=Tolypocladium ophioglossoides (strain CBS 100239) TaxID=1163406 RepID=A0A0L0N276_TOLOC|nr:hypothetical protein TOPH_07219 [Tolypocladium ophioglossoides CBS 100239]